MRSGDVEGYDAVFLSPHKFVGGPGTPGILLMNKALYQLRSSPPSTCGGGTVAYVNGFDEKVSSVKLIIHVFLASEVTTDDNSICRIRCTTTRSKSVKTAELLRSSKRSELHWPSG